MKARLPQNVIEMAELRDRVDLFRDREHAVAPVDDDVRVGGVARAQHRAAGLHDPPVLVLDEQNRILHAELVSDIKHEPNYDTALAVLR